MTVNQTAFRSAILDPSQSVPAGLTNPDGTRASKRFDIYRNNVVVSLIEALITAFPALHRQTGDTFFRALAVRYLRKHPPKSPLMMYYGEDMPAFLESQEQLRAYPYLPDLARLELARRHAYHAADSTPIQPDALAIAPEILLKSRLMFAPAVQIICSDHPLAGIWHAIMENGPDHGNKPEDVIITRPNFDPVVTKLPSGAANFLSALKNGHNFGNALEFTGLPDFDLSTTLGILLSGAAMTKISEGT